MNKLLDKYSLLLLRIDELILRVKKKYFFWGAIVLFMILISILNISYPLFGDDWRYSFIHGTGMTARTNSFIDSLHSQYSHYMTWGGRSVLHFIDENLLRLPILISDLLNSLMFVILLVVVYLITNVKLGLNPLVFIITSLLIWIFQPAFGQSFLWLTGSANYLWGTVIILSFIYFYVRSFMSPIANNSNIQSIVFFFTGVVTGWTNENSVVGVIFLIFGIILYRKANNENVPKWFYSGWIGVIIGFCVMIMAPGNFVRMDGVLDNDVLYDTSRSLYYLSRFRDVCLNSYQVLVPLIFVYFLLLFVLPKRRKVSRRQYFISILFLVASFISTFVMIMVPQFSLRVLTCPVTFIIISIGFMLNYLDYKNPFNKKIITLGIIGLVSYFIPYYYEGYKDVTIMGEIFRKREILIEEQDEKKSFYLISYDRFVPQTKFTMMYDLSSDPNEWDNLCYSTYHGIQAIRVGD